MRRLNWINYQWLWVSGLVLLIDQLSKHWMLENLSLWQSVWVTHFFNVTLAFNTGAAFSVLAQASGWQNLFLLIMAMVISLIVLIWLGRATLRPRLPLIGLTLIFGGASGNIIDRFRHGHVVDFLDFHLGDYHWPVFNVADSAITIGAGLLMIQILLDYLNRRTIS
ncbi:MAG: lipoprotein signal peptidase [Legionellales bacterium]|nr:lipoprotein signal peptidase [Legionellales bacterium]